MSVDKRTIGLLVLGHEKGGRGEGGGWTNQRFLGIESMTDTNELGLMRMWCIVLSYYRTVSLRMTSDMVASS